MVSRRTFIQAAAGGAVTLYLVGPAGERVALGAPIAGGTLAADRIPQFTTAMPRPGIMPRTDRLSTPTGYIDRYDVGVRQFRQQMLPAGYPSTTVWGYGPANGATSEFHTPSATILATHQVPTRVTWVNQLVDANQRALPHLLPVDPTLHWANPERRPNHHGMRVTDSHPDFTGLTYVEPAKFTDPTTQYTAYRGPVPMVAHLHGAKNVGDESDGYPEAWALPAATDIPADYARHGRWYEFFAAKSKRLFGVDWKPGTQVSQYPNTNRATTLWFHDHALGLTRLNVYAGPVGFYLVQDDEPRENGTKDATPDAVTGLPGGRTTVSKGQGEYELVVAIQDRSFNADGSLFYPDTRAFFDGYAGPYVPETPVSPIWNPEFYGNTLLVNGAVWPFQTVERRRYRMRVLNGCNGRFLILNFGAIPGLKVHQIGNDGGYLPAPYDLAADDGHLTLAPAERADLVLDFTGVAEGRYVLPNLGPDAPYGGDPVGSFPPADPATTGRVLQFRVVASRSTDPSLPAAQLKLPPIPALPSPTVTRRVALLEHSHSFTDGGSGPTKAMLGTVTTSGGVVGTAAVMWMDPITENPVPGGTETWEVYNFTVDAHPVHLHEVAFQVVDRQDFSLTDGSLTLGERHEVKPGERGRKDTVIAAPGQITRIRATFGTPGQYVWHCHVLEHEDNEMMRPFRIGPVQPGQPD